MWCVGGYHLSHGGAAIPRPLWTNKASISRIESRRKLNTPSATDGGGYCCPSSARETDSACLVHTLESLASNGGGRGAI